MNQWLKNLLGKNRHESPEPGSETFLIDQVIEKARKERIEMYNKCPQLLIDDVQKIADEHPEVIKEYGGVYFMTFAAGVLVERFGISIEAANEATSSWNYRLVMKLWDEAQGKATGQKEEK